MAEVSPSDQTYWLAKLGGNFTNVGNPDPAYIRAQWLAVAQTGNYLPNAGFDGLKIPNTPIVATRAVSPEDLAIGLAWSKSYADQAGVTPAQLATAQANLATQIAGKDYNLAGGVPTPNESTGDLALQEATYKLTGGHTLTTAQISYMNLKQGVNPTGEQIDLINSLQTDPEFAKLGTVCSTGDVCGNNSVNPWTVSPSPIPSPTP
jgi:hypothetical protein